MCSGWRAVSAGLILTAALRGGEAAAQTPFEFLFGAPRRAARPHHREPRQPQSNAVSDAPLPVPRPHIATDAPKPTALPEAPSPTPKLSTRLPESGTEAPRTSAGAPAAPLPATTPTGPPIPRPPTAKDAADTPRTDAAHPPQDAARPAAPPTPPPRPSDLDRGAATGPATPAPPPPKDGGGPDTNAPRPPAPPPVAPSGAAAGATRQPAEDQGCPDRLKARNVVVEPATLGPPADDRCTLVQPLRLAGMTGADGTKIDFPDRPTLACVTADTFTRYVSEMLSPLAKGTYSAPVGAVWTGPGFECRSRDHVFGAKLSAHALGLAVDIAQLKLTDGRIIAVGTPKSPSDEAFESAARAAGCGYFHTVLGPGSDEYHRTHWHFDLEQRGAKGDSKFCK